jgi:hypothetical protein
MKYLYFLPHVRLFCLRTLWICLSSIGAAMSAHAQPTTAPHIVPPASLAAEVYFVNLKDGDRVRSPFRVIFGLSRLGLAPAGIDKAGTGHHHLLINTTLPADLTKPIPFSDSYRHYGGGQSETILTLKPGKHTLQLLFADHAHKPYVKTPAGENIVVFSKQITIEVLP